MSRQPLSVTKQEITVVQAKLELIRKQEAQYESLILRLQDLQAVVTEERRSLEQRERDLESMRIPVNWLPNEILGQVFVSLVEQDPLEDATSDTVPNPANPSISVSHVNQRWRAVAFATHHVWSNIHLRGRWNPERARIFLTRSGCAPLDIFYSSPQNITRAEERSQALWLLKLLKGDLHRLKRFDVSTRTAEAMTPLVRLFEDPLREFPRLESLLFSIMTFDPHFLDPNGLVKNNIPTDSLQVVRETPTPSWNRLTHLKLEEIPLFNFPYHYIANLHSLELTCPPRKVRPSRMRYHLKMSALLHFLSLSTSLEELTLNNTIPFFDVVLPTESLSSGNSNLSLLPTRPVKLSRLKAINWTFPPPADVHRLLSFIECPTLEKLDLWVENPNPKEEPVWHGYEVSLAAMHSALPAVIDCTSVRELCFQCPADENVISSLRRFTFPNLEKFELVTVASKGDLDAVPGPLMVFPRLESIFRDPRLFSLTHLTLSCIEFKTEHRKREAVLGYMPALTSLSLESCTGVGNLIKVLEERFSSIINLPRGRRRLEGGVKVCPHLEVLSFWGCADLRISSLLKIVRARNEGANGVEEAHDEPGPSDAWTTDAQNPHEGGGTKNQQNITGTERNGKGPVGSGNAVPGQVMGREIKPLRKSVNQQMSSGGPASPCERGDGGPFLAGPHSNTPFFVHEVLPPSLIVYMRIHRCALIRAQDVRHLKNLGVLDVAWLGAE